MKTELLYVQNLTKKVNQNYVLDNISFSAFKGEVLGIVGLNDSGIYALADLLSGKEGIDSGEIYIDDKKIAPGSRTRARKCGLYYIEFSSNLVPNFTVAENIYITNPPVIQPVWVSMKALTANTQRIFDEYDIQIDIHKKTYQLTQCEQNIVEIMRAVIRDVKVIVLDSILANYSQNEATRINRLLKKLAEKGMAVVLVGTEVRSKMDVADRLIVLGKGRVEGVFYKGEYSERNIYSALAQTDLASINMTKCESSVRVVLELRQMSFPEYNISQADFFVKEGETVGFIDHSGRGFAKIVDILSGEEAYSGHIYLNGKRIVLTNSRSAVRKGIGLLSRHDLRSMVFDNLTLGENILLIKYPEYTKLGFINKKICRFAIREYIKLYDLPPSILNKYPNEVSAHVKAIIPLIKWIAIKPKVMLLRDPFAGADAIIEKNINTFIHYLKGNGVSIVFSSSSITELESICDRIYTIERGGVSIS